MINYFVYLVSENVNISTLEHINIGGARYRFTSVVVTFKDCEPWTSISS